MDGGIVLDIDVPADVPATLELPGLAPQTLCAGRQRIAM
jgi:hypothetical protein